MIRPGGCILTGLRRTPLLGSGLLSDSEEERPTVERDVGDADFPLFTPRANKRRRRMPSAGVAEVAVVTPVKHAAGDRGLEAEISTPVAPAKTWLHSIKKTSCATPIVDPHARCRHMRGMKALRAEQAEVLKVKAEIQPIKQAWNKRVTHHGDRIPVWSEEEMLTARMNQYLPEAVLRHAWKGLGKWTSERDGVDGVQKNSLNILACVSSAVQVSQSHWLQNVIDEAVDSGGCPFLQRHYDSTSNRMCMGQLQEVLMPMARYAVRQKPSDPWRIVGWQEYRATHRAKPKFGIFELLAQSTSFHWSCSKGFWNGCSLVHSPQVLQRSNASTIYRAVDMGTPPFSPVGLRELCGRVHHMWINEQPDGCPTNKRKKAKSSGERPRNCFDLSEQTCMPHQLWRVVHSRFSKVVGDLYALHVTCSNSHHQNSLQKELRDFIDEDFQFRIGAPSPHCIAVNRSILGQTLFRRQVYVKGGACKSDVVLQESALARDVLEFFNCSWDTSTLTHCCPGCCSGVEDARSKCFSLLLRMDVLMADDTRAPCMDNWDTLGKGLGKASLSVLVHNVLPQVLARALPSWQACLPGGHRALQGSAEAAARSFGLQKKAWRSKCVLENKQRCLDILLLNSYGLHIEHLLMTLDWMDERGDGYMDLVLHDTCPFSKCLRAISKLLQCDATGPNELSHVYRHFGHSSLTPAEIRRRSFVVGNEFGAQLSYRSRPVKSAPYSLLGMVHPEAAVTNVM